MVSGRGPGPGHVIPLARDGGDERHTTVASEGPVSEDWTPAVLLGNGIWPPNGLHRPNPLHLGNEAKGAHPILAMATREGLRHRSGES